MSGHPRLVLGLLGILAACALIPVGCGDDDDSTTTDASAEERIDRAVESCTTNAQDLPDAAASALESACSTVGKNAKQALSQGGEQAEEALSQAAETCMSTVSQLPDGEAQDALSDLCAAIES
jgi:hypothetical protein